MMLLRSVTALVLAALVALVIAEITPNWPPSQPVFTGPGLGSRTGSVLPCDADYWQIETFTDVQIGDYLVIDFNQTGEARHPGDRGALYIRSSIYSDLKQELASNRRVIDTFGELPGPGVENYDYRCELSNCKFEINCEFTNTTYYLAVVGGRDSIVHYNFTVVRRTLNITALNDRRPLAVFNDSQRRVLNELQYRDPPAPSFPDRSLRYRFYSLNIPQSQFSEGTYFVVNISRVEPFLLTTPQTMRLFYNQLPFPANDTGLLGHTGDDSCVWQHCVDTRLNAPTNFQPFSENPVRLNPRVPCECTPQVQDFGSTYQLTCNVTVDPCTFQYGTWYIGIRLYDTVDLYSNSTLNHALAETNYTLTAIVYQPVVTTLFRNVTFKGFVEPERATHYKITAPASSVVAGSSHLLVHVSNIRGGTVDVFVHGGDSQLAGGREGCAPAHVHCRTSDACNLVVEKCHFSAGTWYVSLEVAWDAPTSTSPVPPSQRANYFLVDDFDRLPITFTIRSNWMQDAPPVRLLAGVPAIRYIGEALYDFYVVDVPATIDTWLFVELYTQCNEQEVILSVLHGALPGGECYDRPDFYCLTGDPRHLTIPGGNPLNLIDAPQQREACSFMIQTCELEAGPLYLSVYGHHYGYAPYDTPDTTFYQIPVHYTLWVDFDVALALDSGVAYSEHVFEKQYQHYYIRADNVNEGSSLSVEVTNIQHGIPQSLEVFVNYNYLAGNCPCYDHLFNCTGSRQPSCGGAVANSNPNFLPSPETVATCCTILVPPCDFRSGVWYVSVLGVNENRVQYTTPIGYTLTVTVIDAPPVRPLIVGQVAVGEVSQWNQTNQYNHYKLAARPLPLHDLVLKLVYVQNCEYRPKHDNLRDTLTLFVNHGNLATSECLRYSCNANIEGHSYCTVVVPHCEWAAEDWFVAVQGNFDAVFPGRYTLRASVEEVRDTQLLDGVSVYGRVASNRYQHYYIDVSSASSRFLHVDVYTNADQDRVSAYLNVDERAGRRCFRALHACENECFCSFQLEGCELEPARYYVAVYGVGHQFYDISVEYTLTATLRPATYDLTEGDPVTGTVLLGQSQHYKFAVPDVSDGQYLLFSIDNVKSGVVTVFLNHGSLAGRCSNCDTYAHLDSCVADSDNLLGGAQNWCELRVPPCALQSGAYYFSVVGHESKTPYPIAEATAIGFTVEVTIVNANIATPSVQVDRNVANTLRFQFVSNNRYRHFAFRIDEQQWTSGLQVAVEISNIRDGALFVYHNKDTPGDSNPLCESTRICGSADMGVGGSCNWQLPFCQTRPGLHYISVEGVTGRLQASFDILIYLQKPLSLTSNVNFAGLTGTLPLGITPTNEVTAVHPNSYQPNGGVQFIRLTGVQRFDDSSVLEVFFYNIRNNAGDPTDFEVYLYPERPAGPHECCGASLGSCQTFPCLSTVSTTTQVYRGAVNQLPVASHLCSGGDYASNSSLPFGYGGQRCNATVWSCDFAAAQPLSSSSLEWWLTVIPVRSGTPKPNQELAGLQYSVQWRVRSSRAATLPAATVDLSSAINAGATDYYGLYQFEQWFSASFFVSVTSGQRSRVVVQTQLGNGTSAGDVVVYINRNEFANPGTCSEPYQCPYPGVTSACDCDGRFVSSQCCTRNDRFYISVRNIVDRATPVFFRFVITLRTEDAPVVLPSLPLESAPFVATSTVAGENYAHYRLVLSETDILTHTGLVYVLQKSDAQDASPLHLFVRAGETAGTPERAANHLLPPGGDNTEQCLSYRYTCVASGTFVTNDPFSTSGRCVLQLPQCVLYPREWYASVYNPAFLTPQCTVSPVTLGYSLTIFMQDQTTQLTLGTPILVPSQSPLGYRSTAGTYHHYRVAVTPSDIAYDPRNLASGFYTRFLRFQIDSVTLGLVDMYVNYDRLAGDAVAHSCLDNVYSTVGCETPGNCVVDVQPCGTATDNERVYGLLQSGNWFVSARVAPVAAFSLQAVVLSNEYTPVPGVRFTRTDNGADATQNAVYEVSPTLTQRTNANVFRYIVDTSDLHPGDDEDTVSSREYFLANLTIPLNENTPSVTVEMWRDDCYRWECTASGAGSFCVIDATELSTCSAKGGRFYFRVISSQRGVPLVASAFTLSFYRLEATVQAIRDGQTLTEAIFDREIQEYFFAPTDLGAGAALTISVAASCGDVQVFVRPDGRAGPQRPATQTHSEGLCNIASCVTSNGDTQRHLGESTATCEILLDTCVYTHVGYWIAVRGVQQTFPSVVNANLELPVRYNIKVQQTNYDVSPIYANCPTALTLTNEPQVRPHVYRFSQENVDVGTWLRFSMRTPSTYYVSSFTRATMRITFAYELFPAGMSDACSSFSCDVTTPGASCNVVLEPCVVNDSPPNVFFIWADAPRGTELLVEEHRPTIPTLAPGRVYPGTLDAYDSTEFKQPFAVGRQYYRVDVDPSSPTFFLRTIISNVRHGVVSATMNSAEPQVWYPFELIGNCAGVGQAFLPQLYLDNCASVTEGDEPCVMAYSSCEVTKPRTFFITVVGVQQTCPLHSVQYDIEVVVDAEYSKLAINNSTCDSVFADEYKWYRLSPHAVEEPQQSILKVSVSDVDSVAPGGVQLVLRDNHVPGRSCFDNSVRSSFDEGFGQIERVCGYSELFLGVYGIRGADAALLDSLVNYRITVEKQVVNVQTLRDNIEHEVDDRFHTIGDDSQACPGRYFFRFDAQAVSDHESYLEVRLQTPADLSTSATVYVNRGSFADAACSSAHCTSGVGGSFRCYAYDACTFASGTYFLTVNSQGPFSIAARVRTNPISIALGSTTRGKVDVSDNDLYKLVVSASDLSYGSRLVVEVSDVFYGDVSFSIARSRVPFPAESACALDTRSVSSAAGSTLTGALVLPHDVITPGTYLIRVSGVSADQNCRTVRYAVRPSIHNLGISAQPVPINSVRANDLLSIRNIDISDANSNPTVRYYKVSALQQNKKAFGVFALHNVRGGLLRMIVAKGHLATPKVLRFPNQPGFLNPGDLEPVFGATPRSLQELSQEVSQWSCTTSGTSSAVDTSKFDRSCFLRISPCEWGFDDFYIAVEALQQDYDDHLVSYDLVVREETDYTPLTSGHPIAANFTQGNLDHHLYAVAAASHAESVSVRVRVSQGSVSVRVRDHRCPELATYDRPYFCNAYNSSFPWLCEIDILSRAAHSGATQFFVTVSGRNATYDVSSLRGRQNCHEFSGNGASEGLDFCSGLVQYSTWRHDNYVALDSQARCFFEQLYDHFRVQPCWSGVTPECNATLQRFACYESFKRCDQDGFAVGTCRKACESVVYECVNWFESVGLPSYNCSSHHYLDDSAQACTGHLEQKAFNNNVFLNDPHVLLFENTPSFTSTSTSDAATVQPVMLMLVLVLLLSLF